MNLSVSTQSQGIVGERLWTDEFLTNPGNVRPWGIQCVPIPLKASGEPRMRQLRTLGGDKDMRPLSFFVGNVILDN